VVLDFLVRWFSGPSVEEFKSVIAREVGYCVGDLKGGSFVRDSYSVEGLELLWRSKLSKVFRNANVFMGVGFWVGLGGSEPELGKMLYDRVVFDFDSKEDPKAGVEAALNFATTLQVKYKVTPLVFESGFKGAHVVVPLSKPTDWDGYQMLWKHFLTLIPKEYRALVDKDMLQWNRLDRVPLTWNVKEGRKAFAKFIHPKEFTYENFSWGELQLLDPSEVVIEKLPEIPKPKELKPRPKPKADNAKKAWGWVDDVVKSGLPDGRHRFILHVLSPYLANVVGLGVDEYLAVVREFIDNSCRNWGNCGKIYDSWIKSDFRRVKSKGVMPWGLKAMKEKDPDLYEIVAKALNNSIKTESNSSVCLNDSYFRLVLDFVSETGLREFSYRDLKEWLERKQAVTADYWHSIERKLRELASSGCLGRKYLVNGVWVDYGSGPLESPPSREVRFYLM